MLTATDSLDHKYKTHQEIAEQYNLFRRELGTKTSRWKPASPQVVRKRIFEIREKLGDHRDIIQGMFGAGYKIDLNYAISEDDNILED
jgi:DNA-binding winged helix-turn-helix (wHTH) protein